MKNKKYNYHTHNNYNYANMIIPEIGREDLEIGTQIYNRADEYEGGATVSLNHTELLRIIEEEIGDDK